MSGRKRARLLKPAGGVPSPCYERCYAGIKQYDLLRSHQRSSVHLSSDALSWRGTDDQETRVRAACARCDASAALLAALSSQNKGDIV